MQGWPDCAPAIRNRDALQMRCADSEAYRAANIWDQEGKTMEKPNTLGLIDKALKAQWTVADESDAVRRDPIYAAIVEDTARLQKLSGMERVDRPFEEMRKRPEGPERREVLSSRMAQLDAELTKRLEL